MPTITVKVPKLNQRTSPATNAKDKSDISGVVYKGFSFESTGTTVNEMGVWYMDGNGHYYWGGGVDVTDTTPTISYKTMLNLDEAWAKTDGGGTTIVIIDTGINNTSPAFNADRVTERDLTAGTSNDKDHGTFVGGIIAGYKGAVNGIAPGAAITAIRYKDENTPLKTQLANMKTALEQAIALKTTTPTMKLMVNMSQGFNSFQVSTDTATIGAIADTIRKLAGMGALIVCAAGDNEQLAEGGVLFPANMAETIGVGAVTSSFAGNAFPVSVDVIMPLNEYNSYDSGLGVITDMGSSFCTAIVTGIATLLCASLATMPDKATFINAIAQRAAPLNTFDYNPLTRIQFKTTRA